MATLTGNTIASTYLPLLRITNNTMGVAGTAYYIKDSADTNSALSISTTSVGIGTAAPSSPLSVESNIGDGEVMAHFFDGTMADTDFFTINIGKDATTHDCGVLKFYHTANGHTQNYISLGLKSTEDTLVVNSNGRVGIGETAPSTSLHVSSADENLATFTSSDDTAQILIQDGASGDTLYVGVSDDNNQGWVGFFSGVDVRNLNISDQGHVGIGCNPNATFPFDVRDDVASGYMGFFFNDGDDANRYGIKVQAGADDGSGTTYYIRADDGDGHPIGYLQHATSFSAVDASDVRLKKDIVDTAVEGLNTVNGMKVRDFKWIKNDEQVTAGFVANELKTAFPSAVFGEENAMEDILDDDGNKTGERIAPMTIGRDLLVPVLVKAIQELSAKVTALENA
jgi:hypothetical protein